MWIDVLWGIPLECQKPKQSPCSYYEQKHIDAFSPFVTHKIFPLRSVSLPPLTTLIIFMQFCRAFRTLDIPPLAGSMLPNWFLPPPRFLWHPWRWLCSISFRTKEFTWSRLDATHDDVDHFEFFYTHTLTYKTTTRKQTHIHTQTTMMPNKNLGAVRKIWHTLIPQSEPFRRAILWDALVENRVSLCRVTNWRCSMLYGTNTWNNTCLKCEKNGVNRRNH